MEVIQKMSKKILVRAAAVGMAGVTAVTPMSGYALQGIPSKGFIMKEVQDVSDTNPVEYVVSLAGNYVICDGVLYYGSNASIIIDSVPGSDPIKEVEVDGSIVYNNHARIDLSTVTENTEFSISSESSTVKKSIFTLLEGYGSFSSLSSDVEAPVVSLDSIEGTNTSGYYVGNIDLVFNVSDNSVGVDVNSIKVNVNGDVIDTFGYDSDSSKLTVNVNAENLISDNVVSVEVSDVFGNTGKSEASFKADGKAPIVNAKNDYAGEKYSFNGNTYLGKEVNVSFSVEDDNSGVSRIELLKDDVTIKSFSDTESICAFTLNENGKYSILVGDVAGNVKVYALSEFLEGFCDSVILDSKGSDIAVTVNNEVPDTGWYKDEANLKVVARDDNLIKNIRVIVNGNTEEIKGVDSSEYSYELDLTTVSDESGIVNFEYFVEDGAGNTSSYTKMFKVDSTAPTVENVNLNGEVSYTDGKAFIKNPITLHGDVIDRESGIQTIQIMRDNEVVSTSLPYVISESGNYSIRLVDGVGHVVEKTLGELVGKEFSEVIVDSESPIISRESGFRPSLILSGVNWYKYPPTLVYAISDDNLESVVIKVNGKEVHNGLSEDSRYSIPLDIPNSSYIVEVVAVDKAKNEISDVFSFSTDNEAPEVSEGILIGDYKDRGYGLYFKENPRINVVAKDSGTGVYKYFLSKNGVGFIGASEDGCFTLSSGEYGVRVNDELENASDYKSIKDLCGLSSNRIVVDSEAPVISCSRPEGSINNWFSKDVVYKANISDNSGIYLAEISINGKVVETFKAGQDEPNVELVANTSLVDCNEDGSYHIKVTAEDNSGYVTSWSDVVYIDKEAPVIDKFVFSGQGNSEGNIISGIGDYGFYFRGGAIVDIYVSDGKISSGVSKINYTFKNETGDVISGEAEVKAGVARVAMPDNFKGFISAFAIDSVGNRSSDSSPDGVITEDSNWHVNNSNITITLPDSDKKDIFGNILYAEDINITADISGKISGLRTIEWGNDDTVLGRINIGNKGNISGDTAYIRSKDKNLVVDLSKTLSISDNRNGFKVWIRVEDRAGYVSEASRVISIDKDVPVVSVSYDNNSASNYYNSTRSATIRIRERNFNPNDVVISGIVGSVGSWSNIGEDTWICPVIFSNDGEYEWSVAYTDLAGNKSNIYTSEKFIVDKTAPVIEVRESGSAENGNYYKDSRVFTVSVVDKNFDPNLVKLTGDDILGSWSNNGDTHTAYITFDKDGEYEFSLEASDMAGNASGKYSSGKFIIDRTIPDLSIVGVQDGVSYKNNVGFNINFSDNNLDSSRSYVRLVGRSCGEVYLSGRIDATSGKYVFDGVPDGIEYDDLYSLKIVIYDKAGNRVERGMDFSINRYGSRYAFLGKDLLNTVIANPEKIEVEETSVDRIDMDSVEVVIIKDGVPISVDKKYIHINEQGGVSGPWVYRYKIDKEAFSEDGKYQVQIYSKALDGTSNSSLKEEYSFILDTTCPEVIVSGIEDNGSYNEVSKKVTIDVRDLSGISNIQAYLNGKEVKLSNENGMYYLTIGESNELQSLKIEVEDEAGNITTVEVKDFLITSNVIQSSVNNKWFKLGIGALAAILAAIIALIIKNRRDNKKDEAAMISEHSRLYKESTTGSSSGSNSSTNSEDNSESKDK